MPITNYMYCHIKTNNSEGGCQIKWNRLLIFDLILYENPRQAIWRYSSVRFS